RMFKEKKGVVINTCHGVKGEEYECVIAFGLLYGKVPRLSDDLNTFKRMFKEKKGVVINTCHGVKGEEYECVIAFGLLYGKVPNIHTEQSQRDSEAKKIIVCYRFKS
ncbi:hypothetical protein DXA17_19380, partial [Ruminococcus sp. AM58-7XD]